MSKYLLAAAAAVVLISGAFQAAQAQKRGSPNASSVIIDTGDTMGGFNVSIGTTTTVLISSSGYNAGRVWRMRTMQVTGTTYAVWMSTYTPLTYGSGAGWYVLGSTSSFTTRSQAAIYGILDPNAGSGTAAIKGVFEYQTGDAPRE